jgi:hypothetical protein
VEQRVPIPYAGLNAFVRVAVLLLLAYFIALAAWQNRELQKELRVLESLLPVCMGCKRIRDKHGEWQPVDVYVTHNTDSLVSHGLCPDCAQRLYGHNVTEDAGSPEPAQTAR